MSLDGLTWMEIAEMIDLQLHDGANIYEFVSDSGLENNALYMFKYLGGAQRLLKGLQDIAIDEYEKVKEKHEEEANAAAADK